MTLNWLRGLVYAGLLVYILTTGSQAAALSCADAFSDSKTSSAWARKQVDSPAEREAAIAIILKGSRNVSRTVQTGAMVFENPALTKAEVAIIAEKNFENAVRFIVENYEALPINLETARRIVEITTRTIESDQFYTGTTELARLKFDFRSPNKRFREQLDAFFEPSPRGFYDWLESDAAAKLFKSDPIRLAEIVHNNIVTLDSFPDGNGRLSRLFADLVLLKAGYAPASYTKMEDYFARGSARAPVSRSEREQYFREITASGQALLEELVAQN